MVVDRAAVLLTAHEITAHPAVVDVTGPIFEGDGAWLEFKLDLGFGARWMAEGASPTGVQPREPVRLDFRPSFPRTAPQPSLRPDFSRHHPHIQPYLGHDGRPVPCLVDGSLGEFFSAQGASRLIDQFVLWLLHAADGRLIDPEQGWEPMRRDGFVDDLICDPDQLRAVVTPTGGFKAFELSYAWRRPTNENAGFFIGQLFRQTTAQAASGGQWKASKKGETVQGLGLGFVVWAGRDPAGGPAIASDYAPDDVVDLSTLKARAAALRMTDSLRAVLSMISRLQHAGNQTFPVPIILAVRRPCKLKDSNSDVELCPYLLPATAGAQGLGNPLVTPLGLHDEITPALLGRMSDAPRGSPWALLGCGSLGSKIALHRARDGAAPLVCGDARALLPHNAARHALYPGGGASGWYGGKADALGEVLTALGQPPISVFGDQRNLVTAIKSTPGATWLVNTTASTVAREDLGGNFDPDIPRIVEACLFDQGSLGYLGVEGASRNPDTVELMGELYAAAQADNTVGAKLFPENGPLVTVNIGQGCGSLTMKVSDAKISIHAAIMAETVAALSPSMANGRIDLFVRNGLGLAQHTLDVEPWRRLPLEGLEGWTLSVSPRALANIETEAAEHPKVETGGVLIGFHSTLARRIYVTDVFPAPPDSIRKASEFILGVEGLTEARLALAKATCGTLTFAGTWHSHLGAAMPSNKDRQSAAMVGGGELLPKAFLIHGVDGLRAICAVTPAVLGLKE